MRERKRIKVLLATEAAATGTRKHVVDLALNLSKKRFDVTVCYSSHRADRAFLDSIGALETCGCRVVRIDLEREIRPLADLQGLWKYFSLIRREKFDVVHVHSSKAGFIGRIAGGLSGVPAILYTPHGISFLQDNSTLRKKIYYLAERIASLAMDRLITVSGKEARNIIRSGLVGEKKVVTIPNGIDSAPYGGVSGSNGNARGDLGISRREKVVGTVSRLSAKKAPEYFFRAASIVLKSYPDVKFVFVGGGEKRSEMEILVRDLGIEKNVRLLGDRPDVAKYLRMMDVFVLTSVAEEMPYVILEAMACSLPIVSTNVIDPALLKDRQSGILVPPRSAEEIARAVLKILEDDGLASRLGHEARGKVQEDYSLSRMVDSVEEQYLGLLRERPIQRN